MASKKQQATLMADLDDLAGEIVEATMELAQEDYGLSLDARNLRETFDAMMVQAMSTTGGVDALQVAMQQAGYSEAEINAAIDGHAARQMQRSRR